MPLKNTTNSIDWGVECELEHTSDKAPRRNSTLKGGMRMVFACCRNVPNNDTRLPASVEHEVKSNIRRSVGIYGEGALVKAVVVFLPIDASDCRLR